MRVRFVSSMALSSFVPCRAVHPDAELGRGAGPRGTEFDVIRTPWAT